jgi:hypothetical protein
VAHDVAGCSSLPAACATIEAAEYFKGAWQAQLAAIGVQFSVNDTLTLLQLCAERAEQSGDAIEAAAIMQLKRSLQALRRGRMNSDEKNIEILQQWSHEQHELCQTASAQLQLVRETSYHLQHV